MPDDAAALTLLEDLLARAAKAGADAADAVWVKGTSLSHAQRLGEIEKLERSEGQDLGLRVFIGKRQAAVSSSDQKPEALDELVERAVAMARAVPEDRFCGLAEPEQLLAGTVPELEICDPSEPAPEAMIERARAAEDAARAVPGVTNSEGAESSWNRSQVVLAASNGFRGAYAVSYHGVGVSVLAGEGTKMERDYDFSSAVFAADLEDAATVGRRAGEKAVRRLNPRRAPTKKVPVLYDPRAANGMLRNFAGAINGVSIARGTSFLKDCMGQQVFARGIVVVDDPHRRRGLRSRPFDAEGLPTRPLNLVEDGVLTSWVLDLRSARQLGLSSTGHASRGTASPPSPATTNLYLAPGAVTPAELMDDIESGFYVTEVMGFGANAVTGDYSQGAAGFWIEKGELAYPVSEMTVAGNLKEMFLHLTPANDLEFRYATNSPTIRIDGMTVAGQ